MISETIVSELYATLTTSESGPWNLRQLAQQYASLLSENELPYWACAITAFIFLCGAALLPAFVRPNQPTQPPSKLSRLNAVLCSHTLFYGLIAAVLLLFRWPYFGLTELNPDESQLLAAATKAIHDPLPWKDVDGTTHGPVLVYSPLLVTLLGLPIGYGSGRLLATLLLALTGCLLHATISKFTHETSARLAVLPYVTVLALLTNPELLNLSTEQLPMCFAAVGCYAVARLSLRRSYSPWGWFASGCILGLLPLTKLQIVPLGLGIALAGCVLLARQSTLPFRQRIIEFLCYFFGGILPLLFTVAFTYGAGLFDDFYHAYWINNLTYTGRSGQPVIERILYALPVVFTDPVFKAFSISILAAILLTAATLIVISPSKKTLALLFLATACSALSIFCVTAAGNRFWHYLHILPLPLSLISGLLLSALLRSMHQMQIHRYLPPAIVGFYFAITLVPIVVLRINHDPKIALYATKAPAVDASSTAVAVLAYAYPGERLAVWGWRPSLFVQTGLVPATRVPHSQREIESVEQFSYYRPRYLADVQKHKPVVFVDAVGPKQFAYVDRSKLGHETFRELAHFVKRFYQQVPSGTPVRIYVRQDRLFERAQLATHGAALTQAVHKTLRQRKPRTAGRYRDLFERVEDLRSDRGQNNPLALIEHSQAAQVLQLMERERLLSPRAARRIFHMGLTIAAD